MGLLQLEWRGERGTSDHEFLLLLLWFLVVAIVRSFSWSIPSYDSRGLGKKSLLTPEPFLFPKMMDCVPAGSSGEKPAPRKRGNTRVWIMYKKARFSARVAPEAFAGAQEAVRKLKAEA